VAHFRAALGLLDVERGAVVLYHPPLVVT
jgi:hypothetical protein